MTGEAPAPGQAAREALRQAFREHSGGCPGQECADCDRLDAEFMTLADAYALAAQETAQSAVSALQRLADKTPMGNWDEPEPAEVALRRDYAQVALDALTAAAQEQPAPASASQVRRHAEQAAPEWWGQVAAEHTGMRNALNAIAMGITEPSPKTVAENALNGRYFDPMNDSGAWRLTEAEPKPAPELAAAMAVLADEMQAAAGAAGDDKVAAVLHEYAGKVRLKIGPAAVLKDMEDR